MKTGLARFQSWLRSRALKRFTRKGIGQAGRTLVVALLLIGGVTTAVLGQNHGLFRA
jgi:hypothetical protein